MSETPADRPAETCARCGEERTSLMHDYDDGLTIVEFGPGTANDESHAFVPRPAEKPEGTREGDRTPASLYGNLIEQAQAPLRAEIDRLTDDARRWKNRANLLVTQEIQPLRAEVDRLTKELDAARDEVRTCAKVALRRIGDLTAEIAAYRAREQATNEQIAELRERLSQQSEIITTLGRAVEGKG